MNSHTWPTSVRGNNDPAVAWLNKLRAASLSSHLKDVRFVGGNAKMIPAPDGQTLVLSMPAQSQATPTETILPFTIYQFKNNGLPAISAQGVGYAVNDVVSLYGGQFKVESVGSIGNIVNLIQTVAVPINPANVYPGAITGGAGNGATLTIPTDGNDSWRTFQIRDGLVGWRPRFPQFHAGSLPNNVFIIGSNGDGNFAWTLYVRNDSQMSSGGSGLPVSLFGTPLDPFPTASASITRSGVILQDSTDTLISGFDSGGSTILAGQILLSNTLLGQGGFAPAASFWIEITDSATKGFYANLWGRMIGPIETPRPGVAYPSGNNIIPLGLVICDNFNFSGGGFIPGIRPAFQQRQCGNFLNQYTNSANGGLMNYRGAWGVDSLSGQLFYPGDIVVDDTVQYNALTISGEDGINYYGIFQYTGWNNPSNPPSAFQIETVSPGSSGNTDLWTIIGTTLQIPTARFPA